MTDPIVDIDGLYWKVFSGENAVYLSVCDDPGPCEKCPSEGHSLFILDRANAARLLTALVVALTGKPMPPVDPGEQGEQLELPFPDPPWRGDQPKRH